MQNKIFHLSTCNTCQRIISELDGLLEGVELQNIKERHINEAELDFVAEKLGSYEAAFNKRAMKYRSLGLNTKDLNEKEWKKQILSEYTFLKRPLAMIDGDVFAGNAKKTIESLKLKLNGKNN